MSATASPFGVRPVSHPSGTVRLDQLAGGVLSTYGTSIFTNTPVKRDTNGTLIPCATGADVCIGVFAGCEFSSSGKRFILPYWPAAQTREHLAGFGLHRPEHAVADGDDDRRDRWHLPDHRSGPLRRQRLGRHLHDPPREDQQLSGCGRLTATRPLDYP